MLWEMGRTGAQRVISGRGGGGFVAGVPPEPGPPPPSPPGPTDVVGFGMNATGGGASVTHTVNANASSAASALKAALMASGTRHIKIIGSGDIDSGWESFVVNNGNFTLEGEEWSGWWKHYLQFTIKECSNVLLHHLGLAPGDRVGNVEDASPVKLNGVKNFAVYRNALRWGPDVVGGVLNDSWDGTFQENEIGPALYQSHVSTSPNGYALNVTTPKNGSGYGRRLTFYRNAVMFCKQRSMRAHGTDGIEWVNNAYANWGNDLAHMNPRGANIVGNMFKKGPQTSGDRVFRSETNASFPNYFPQSVYRDDNLSIGFTGTWSFASGVERGSAYGGGLHDVTADPASEALFEDVITNAGRGFDDAVSAAVKAHCLAGTSSGYYNGIGFSAPNSW